MDCRPVISIMCLFALLCPVAVAQRVTDGHAGQSVSWDRVVMDGSRTGCRAPSNDDSEQALGVVRGRRFHAPNGRIFRGGTVGKVAKVVIGAQPEMSAVKTVIGRSSAEMIRHKPECALFDWVSDLVMTQVSLVSGKPVDLSIMNCGGIRVDMPEGDILVDDIRSMFPFRNNLALVSVKGSVLRKHFEDMASRDNLQPVGGAELTVGNGILKELLVGGVPVDDDKVYNLATISFLLDGGDNLFLARDAESVSLYPVMLGDAVIDFIRTETAAGREISHEESHRIKMMD